MGRFILVRHGESEANRDQLYAASGDVPLTSRGRRQAQELAQRISQDFAPSRIITSTFLRARDTAAIIAAELKLPVEIFEGIHERDLGDLKGQPYPKQTEAASLDPAYDPARRWLWRPPGGESFDDVRARVIPVFEQLRDYHPHDEIVIVSHGAVMASVWAQLVDSWEEARGPQNCGIFLIPHAPGRFLAPEMLDC